MYTDNDRRINTMGNRIKEVRKSKGITQKELAEKLGVTPQAVSRWESEAGLPDVSMIVPIAQTLNITTDALLGYNSQSQDEIITKKIFERLLIEEGIKVKEYNDCGLLIYDINKQNVFSGGSGAACSMITIFSFVVKKMEEGLYKKVLVIPTGALLSNTIMNQKETIPSIAHAYSLEVNE
jgi:transcriptional regulator with XRE-family HTH domain